MNFPFKTVRRMAPPLPPAPKGALKAVWVRDPRSGRLSQSWRSSDDGERSCMGRPQRPPHHLSNDSNDLPLAA